MSRGLLASVLLLAVACGPPAGSGTDETGESESSGDTTETTETSGEPTSGGWLLDHPPMPETCDPWQQNCPEGEKCVPYAVAGNRWDANKCVPVLGAQAQGEPCTYAGIVEATDDCDASGYCWQVSEVDGELVGTCHPFCTGTPDDPTCPEGMHCPVYGDGTLTICETVCDPLAQDCDEGLACFWSAAQFICIFTTQDLPAGEACGFVNDCAAGLFCAAADALPSCMGAACCTSYCDVNLGDAACEALIPGTACVPFFEVGMAPAGQEQIGLCVVVP